MCIDEREKEREREGERQIVRQIDGPREKSLGVPYALEPSNTEPADTPDNQTKIVVDLEKEKTNKLDRYYRHQSKRNVPYTKNTRRELFACQAINNIHFLDPWQESSPRETISCVKLSTPVLGSRSFNTS